MLTIFTVPKPFWGEFNVIQRNAIKSWILLKPKSEIILCGDEEGVADFTREFSCHYISGIARNEFGTSLVNDIFAKAQQMAKNEILAYVNTDIILMSDFMKAVERIKNENRFLMVGQRWDLDLENPIDFRDLNWEKNLRKETLNNRKLHLPTGIDYFVFPKGFYFYKDIPPFALGRTVWDEWLLYYAYKKKAKIIDASKMVIAIHQNHSYHYSREGIEAKRNLKLAGGYGHCFTIKDATHILTPEGLKPLPKMSFMRKLEIMPYFGFFIRQRKKLKYLLKRKNERASVR